MLEHQFRLVEVEVRRDLEPQLFGSLGPHYHLESRLPNPSPLALSVTRVDGSQRVVCVVAPRRDDGPLPDQPPLQVYVRLAPVERCPAICRLDEQGKQHIARATIAFCPGFPRYVTTAKHL